MNILKHFRGSILLETLISIVILGLIVTGSFYSYSFVYQTIRSQHHRKIALSVLQGWMERAISLDDLSPNNEDELREEFVNQIPLFFDSDIEDIVPNIDIGSREGMTTINIEINLDGSPIRLYTELGPDNNQ